MRDGSLDDVVAVWMDRIVEEHWGRNPGDNEAAVYFAMLKHSVTGLLATHDRFKPDTDYRKEVGEVLRIVRDRLGPPDSGEVEPEWPEPRIEELAAPAASAAQQPEGKHARYWESHSWRKDFYTSFSRWFWDMKDYAIPAGRRKMDFLWDVGEVWIAAGRGSGLLRQGRSPALEGGRGHDARMRRLGRKRRAALAALGPMGAIRSGEP